MPIVCRRRPPRATVNPRRAFGRLIAGWRLASGNVGMQARTHTVSRPSRRQVPAGSLRPGNGGAFRAARRTTGQSGADGMTAIIKRTSCAADLERAGRFVDKDSSHGPALQLSMHGHFGFSVRRLFNRSRTRSGQFCVNGYRSAPRTRCGHRVSQPASRLTAPRALRRRCEM